MIDRDEERHSESADPRDGERRPPPSADQSRPQPVTVARGEAAHLDLVAFCQALDAARATGIPLSDALAGLADGMPSETTTRWVRQLAAALADGVPLDRAVGALAGMDPLLIALLSRSRPGALASLLAGYARHLAVYHRLADQLRTALLYPALMLLLALVNLAALNLVTFPLLGALTADSGAVPGLAVRLLHVADLRHWPLAIPVPLLLVTLTGMAFHALLILQPRDIPRSGVGRLLGLPSFAIHEERSRLLDVIALFLAAGRSLPEALADTGPQALSASERDDLARTAGRLAEGHPARETLSDSPLLRELAEGWPGIGVPDRIEALFRRSAQLHATAASRYPAVVERIGTGLALVLIGGVVALVCVAIFSSYYGAVGVAG